MTIEEVNRHLALLADQKNAKRSSTITPNAKPMLGARIPDLRRLAKQIAKEGYREFLEQCREDYFEHQLLKAFVLGYAKDEIEVLLRYADGFIPGIRDWCVNDSFCQGFVTAKKHRARVWEWLMPYARQQEEFTQRVAAVLLMSHFLVDEYVDAVLLLMNELKYDGYYTKMGVAWCVATAYAKYPEKTRAFLADNQLEDWTFHKAIQKMTESFRVPEADKAMLRAMKRPKRG